MSKFLVVVDMQKDFIDGSLGSAEAQAVLPKVIEKIKNFPGTVVYTRDTHEDNYLETLEGKKLPVVHCVRDTEGWKFQEDIQELVTANRSLVFDKETLGSIQIDVYKRQQWMRDTLYIPTLNSFNHLPAIYLSSPISFKNCIVFFI